MSGSAARLAYRFVVASGCKVIRAVVRAMGKTLEPIRTFAENYVDDVAVHSATWEKHLADLREFFSVILRSGFTLSLKKSKWARSRIQVSRKHYRFGGKEAQSR
jgi:hypothetical protein